MLSWGPVKDHFHHPQSAEFVQTLDQVGRGHSGREQVFGDFLTMGVCALAGGTMEEEYLRTIQPYVAGEPGQRAVDRLAALFGQLVAVMSETRADILGDVFQGAITRGQQGQFFTPDPLCDLLARLTAEGSTGTVYDPCCGSGRLLLAAARLDRNREFVGQDIDIRCVRITAINLALWNLYGYVLHGNTLRSEPLQLAYRTGFNGRGVIRVADPSELSRFQAESPTPTAPTRPPAVWQAPRVEPAAPPRTLFDDLPPD